MTISAIIPAYNCASTLRRCVSSLIAQSIPPIEIIIVENNSTDNTARIIEALITEYPGKITALFEEKQGAAPARNKGIRNASGEWLQLLDADDELTKDKLSHQIQVIQQHPEVAVIVAPHKVKYITKHKVEHIYVKEIIKVLPRGFITYSMGSTPANLWKKSALESVGLFDESLTSTQEYALMWKLFVQGYTFAFDDHNDTIVHQDYTGESISRPKSWERSKTILQNHINYLQNISTYIKAQSSSQPSLEKLINREMSRMYYFYRIKYNHLDRTYFDKLKSDYQLSTPFLTKCKVIYTQIVLNHITYQGLYKYPQMFIHALRMAPKLLID